MTTTTLWSVKAASSHERPKKQNMPTQTWQQMQTSGLAGGVASPKTQQFGLFTRIMNIDMAFKVTSGCAADASSVPGGDIGSKVSPLAKFYSSATLDSGIVLEPVRCFPRAKLATLHSPPA